MRKQAIVYRSPTSRVDGGGGDGAVVFRRHSRPGSRVFVPTRASLDSWGPDTLYWVDGALS